jgi:hypothetical protein
MGSRVFIGASLLVVAITATISTAWAGWGCGASTQGGAQGRTWNEPSEAKASTDALKLCAGEQSGPCHIVSCQSNVDTADQAHALWPPNGAINERCGTPGQPKC